MKFSCRVMLMLLGLVVGMAGDRLPAHGTAILPHPNPPNHLVMLAAAHETSRTPAPEPLLAVAFTRPVLGARQELFDRTYPMSSDIGADMGMFFYVDNGLQVFYNPEGRATSIHIFPGAFYGNYASEGVSQDQARDVLAQFLPPDSQPITVSEHPSQCAYEIQYTSRQLAEAMNPQWFGGEPVGSFVVYLVRPREQPTITRIKLGPPTLGLSATC